MKLDTVPVLLSTCRGDGPFDNLTDRCDHRDSSAVMLNQRRDRGQIVVGCTLYTERFDCPVGHFLATAGSEIKAIKQTWYRYMLYVTISENGL